MMAQPEQPGYFKPPSTFPESDLKAGDVKDAKSLMRKALREQRKALLEKKRFDFAAQITHNFMAHLEIQRGMIIF